MISTTRQRVPHIDTLRRRIEVWRRTRRHPRAPLPPRLWAAAVALVPGHGVSGTARALGVSYGALKRHVDEQNDDRGQRAAVQLVELPAPRPDGPVLEISNATGLTVRVRLTGGAATDVATIARLVVGAVS